MPSKENAALGDGSLVTLTPGAISQSLYCNGSLGDTRGRRDVTRAVIRKDSFITAVCHRFD